MEVELLAGQAYLVFFIFGTAVLVVTLVLLFRNTSTSGRQLRRQRNARQAAGDRPAQYRRATVWEVVDGETVAVSDNGRRLVLRLEAIACPQREQPLGQTAKSSLIELIGLRDIVYELHSRDGPGKVRATIFTCCNDEWVNVNARLVKLGHARVNPAACQQLSAQRQDELQRMQRWAKSRGLGLWRTAQPDSAERQDPAACKRK